MTCGERFCIPLLLPLGPSTSFLDFPRSHLSIILASKCSSFFLKLLQWQQHMLLIKLGKNHSTWKAEMFSVCKNTNFPTQVASEMLNREITSDKQGMAMSPPIRNTSWLTKTKWIFKKHFIFHFWCLFWGSFQNFSCLGRIKLVSFPAWLFPDIAADPRTVSGLQFLQ